MQKGLVITRSPKQNKNTIQFSFRDSNDELIQITQTIVSTSSAQVRLRVDAPKSVEILRAELI